MVVVIRKKLMILKAKTAKLLSHQFKICWAIFKISVKLADFFPVIPHQRIKRKLVKLVEADCTPESKLSPKLSYLQNQLFNLATLFFFMLPTLDYEKIGS